MKIRGRERTTSVLLHSDGVCDVPYAEIALNAVLAYNGLYQKFILIYKEYMDYKQLESLNKEFAENSNLFIKEFFLLSKKWLKKDPRMTLVMIIQLPINIIFKMMAELEDHSIENAFPELPDMMNRFLSPFYQIKDQWGKIPSKELIEKYGVLYQSQFDEWFPSKEDKKEFEKWYKDHEKRR